MIITEIVRDVQELRRVSGRTPAPPLTAARLALNDSFLLLLLTRLRESARRLRVPFVNHTLRIVQTALFGAEIDKDARLGHGVWFVHTVGTVIGGSSRIGDRVRLLGANCIGTVRDNGYPVIDRDVIIGTHACVLGPVHVGAGAVIGANAVVLHDVPAGAVAVGTPAVVTKRERPWASRRSA
jgi:serine O-acetyltransferase